VASVPFGTPGRQDV